MVPGIADGCWLHCRTCLEEDSMCCGAGADKLSLHELYVEASRPGFMEASGPGAKRLQALCDRLERLTDEQARQLLGSFQACAASVWQGGDAFAAQLRTVEV